MREIASFGLVLVVASLCLGCGGAGGSGAGAWGLVVQVDLGGAFEVEADATIDVTGDTFAADITTVLIGGAEEEHVFTLDGTAEGDLLTVTDSEFVLDEGGEDTVSVTGTVTIDGDELSGSGTVQIHGAAFTDDGTFEVTGTAQ